MRHRALAFLALIACLIVVVPSYAASSASTSVVYLPFVSVPRPTPTTVPTFTPTPRPPTATPTRIPSPTATSCTSYQAIQNPSFENGFAFWGGIRGNPQISGAYHTDGSYSAEFGGFNNANQFIAQTPTVPSWAKSADLWVSTLMFTSDDPNIIFDDLVIDAVTQSGVTLGVLSIPNNTVQGTWFPWKIALGEVSAYHGQSIGVGIGDSTDATFPTTWYVDDVNLVFSC